MAHDHMANHFRPGSLFATGLVAWSAELAIRPANDPA
jgi:hypothetical protein